MLFFLSLIPLAAQNEIPVEASAISEQHLPDAQKLDQSLVVPTEHHIEPVAPHLTSASFVMDLSVPDHPLVRRYRKKYTTPQGLSYLSAAMKRSLPWRQFILEEIEREGIPKSMVFLPIIESSFMPTAVSRAGATGIWQFMKNSIGGFNMRITEWMDERRDPWLSTRAAVRKLNHNYRVLGDWPLALAAYNRGLGAIRRAIKAGGRADYWYLAEKGYFPRETVHYVPKFLAIAEILSAHESWGIDLGDPESVVPTDTIQIKRAIDLAILARELGLDPAFLRSKNPSLTYGITPPDALYNLRVPATRIEDTKRVIETSDKMLLEYYIYRIRSGDTLSALARHYGVSVDMILQHNPGLRPNPLRIGTNIVVPAIRQVSAFTGTRDPDTLDFSGHYIVKSGDTLWSIALAHGIQVETLAERNNITVNSILRLGATLRVPIL